MRVRVHDEPACAAFGSQTVRQSLQRAALHINVISSGLLTLLLGSLRLFGELAILVITLNEEEDCAQSKIYSLLHSCIPQPRCVYIFPLEYSTSSIYSSVTLK